MRAVGLTCGVGSMLIGARVAGFDVVGNVEWRKYYHIKDDQGRNTFTENFPRAFFVERLDQLNSDQIESLKGIDLAMGHPECGAYSALNTREGSEKDPGDISLFISMIKELMPRFFVMDNMPRSLVGCPVQSWAESLPEYDLFPEWVSNYNYGNVQKWRNRFFMIGALKNEGFVFRPGESANRKTSAEVLQGISKKDPCHVGVDPDGDSGQKDLIGRKMSHTQVAAWFRNPQEVWDEIQERGLEFADDRTKSMLNPSLKLWNLPYVSKDGKVRRRIGFCKLIPDDGAYLLIGMPQVFHPTTGLPLTCRERARIQGCPDDFIFVLDDMCGAKMAKQTGKFMPVQFCEYAARQIAAHIRGGEFEHTGKRLIKSNPYVDQAKIWYCKNVGYGHQETVCKECWMDEGKCKSKRGPEQPKQMPVEPVMPKPPMGNHGQKRQANKLNTDLDEIVHLRPEDRLPEDYVGVSKYAEKYWGQLIRPDGSYYNRLERNRYYDPMEKKHPAKTPLHIAKWAIQSYTKPGDWVLDPTMGAGTTAVESLRLGRSVAGVELEFFDVVEANVRLNMRPGLKHDLRQGDARNLKKILNPRQFDLVVNNPPYSGDQREKGFGKNTKGDHTVWYNKDLPNLAHLRENKEYWSMIESIYSQCVGLMKPGARFVVGVKDMMRAGKPFKLHEMLGDVLSQFLSYEGMVLLKHHPTTLFLNTYEKKTGIKPPLYQTVLIFRKETS